ncbi:MAG: HAMP domain-containing histidine kinase [bacterium]|nr:HAMP domain-containing histidine kinase [bacterium]MCM1374362.1 HAMP domain-containing histidine kinase [Muribaculum sp.]
MRIKRKMPMGLYILLMFILCIFLRMFLEGLYDGLSGRESVSKAGGGVSYGWGDVLRDILLDVGPAVLFACLVRRKVLTPIKNLAENMGRIAAGDFSARISLDSPREVYLMGNTFNEMADHLQRAQEDRAKMEENNRLLYSNIAHDLKSPMTMIMGYARVLLQGDAPEGKKREYLETICEQSVHMDELLEVMLSYTRLQNPSYQLTLEKKDVAELLRKCVAQYYLLFEEHGLETEVDIPDRECLCAVDEAELLRAFRNLLSNMLSHTQRGTVCRISLRETRGEGADRLTLCFADSGGPLPELVKERLFEPFCVGDESRNTRGGSGLGLSIVKKAVERNGGEVHYVENWEDGMKAFVVQL